MFLFLLIRPGTFRGNQSDLYYFKLIKAMFKVVLDPWFCFERDLFVDNYGNFADGKIDEVSCQVFKGFGSIDLFSNTGFIGRCSVRIHFFYG